MTLTINLSEKLDAALKAQARATGISEAGFVERILEQVLDTNLPLEEQAPLSGPNQSRPLSARIREIWSDIPDEVRAKLPADGASQHDHYIYGVPKREQ